MDENFPKFYNIAREVVNDNKLVPVRTDAKIIDLVSQSNNWLIFAEDGETRKDRIGRPIPNVYFGLNDSRKDNYLSMGLHFETLGSWNLFKNIMLDGNSELKEKIMNKMNTLNNKWETSISTRTKRAELDYRATPIHKPHSRWKAEEIDRNIITKIITIGDMIRKEGIERTQAKKVKWETPSISLIEVSLPITEDCEELRSRLKEIFELLEMFLYIKSDKDFKKIEAEKKNNDKKIKAIEEQIDMTDKELKFAKIVNNKTMIENRENRLKELKSDLEKLE